MHKAQTKINHVALVLDGSGSMDNHRSKVPPIVDKIIVDLMKKSEKLSQETRVSVYVFDTLVECMIFDMDVMRTPSIKDLYWIRDQTALIDALVKSQEDLKLLPQIYGEHGFLTFVITDGGENASRCPNKLDMVAKYTRDAPENFTVAFLVPDERGATYLQRLGVDRGAIETWDISSKEGFTEVQSKVTQAIDGYMETRATTSTKGSKSLFSAKMGVETVNHNTVRATLEVLEKKKYTMHQVITNEPKIRIDDFVNNVLGGHYLPGKGFYQFMKAETIQGGKEIIVVEKATKVAFHGKSARELIGLEWGVAAKCKPDANPLYDIFVQSTSNNRSLIPGTMFLLMK